MKLKSPIWKTKGKETRIQDKDNETFLTSTASSTFLRFPRTTTYLEMTGSRRSVAMSRLSRLSFSDNEDAWRHNSKKGLTTALIFFSGVSPSLQEEYAQSEKSYIKEIYIYPALHCCSDLNIDNSKQSFRSNHDYQQQKRSIRFLQQCRILVFNLRSANIMSSRVILNFHALI